MRATAAGTGDDGGASLPLGGTAAPRPRRRIPTWAFGAAGAAAALAFGVVVERMRFGPPLVMIALGGMTLAFTGAALWRMIDPLTRESLSQLASPRETRRKRELDREKQLVLKAIKEIELDYQMRKIAERDYREMIERYRARALRLIGEIEAGDDYRALIERELKIRLALPTTDRPKAGPPAPTPAPASTPNVAPEAAPRSRCASCQTANDEDAQFCKKCGTKL